MAPSPKVDAAMLKQTVQTCARVEFTGEDASVRDEHIRQLCCFFINAAAGIKDIYTHPTGIFFRFL